MIQANSTDFRNLFESAPGLYLVLTPPEYIIATASEAYLRATMIKRDEVIGKKLFEVFPDNPLDEAASGARNLKSSLDTVIKNKKTHKMALQRYDVRKPISEGGEFEERYWAPVNTPVFNKQGEIDYILHSAEDVTEFVQLSEKIYGDTQKVEQQVDLSSNELLLSNSKLEFLNAQILKNEKSRLDAVVDNALDGIISMNAKGEITSFNKACERIFGYEAKEVAGSNFKMLLPEIYYNEHDHYIKNYVLTGKTRTTDTEGREVTGKRKDGFLFPVNLSMNAFVLDGEQYFCGIIRDITEQKKADAQLRFLGAIVEHSEDAIIGQKLDSVIVSWNKGAEKLFGYKADEVIGSHVKLIIPPERLSEETFIMTQINQAKSIENLETVRLAKSGNPVEVMITVSPIRDITGEIVGASKVMHDITVRKAAEKKALSYLQELERSNKDLDDFAYIASHDLKEPLRGLFNNAKFLQQDYENVLGSEGVSRLQRIGYLCQRMEQLINDLLYFSRLGRYEMAVQSTNLNKIVHDIESMMETKDATILIPRPLPTITCDKPRITELLRNLISNSVKYNNNEEKIIEIGFSENLKDNTPVFYVKDNGIGIEKEFFEEIFRIFKRLNEEDDSKKGTGVGLTFVRKIVERHGGKIWLESTPGMGTTFYFTLPHKPK